MIEEVIDKSLLDSAMNYAEYTELLESLLANGKTTGDNHSESMLGYAKMNLHRMKRLNKTLVLSGELKSTLEPISEGIILLVLTEGWCGDAAQNIPVFNAISEQKINIELKLILRDENLDIMDQFLTNGGRSIPKLIALKKSDLQILGTWGPRPETAQKMVNEFKLLPDGDYTEFVKEVQLWYAKNKTLEVQSEIASKLNEWNSTIN